MVKAASRITYVTQKQSGLVRSGPVRTRAVLKLHQTKPNPKEQIRTVPPLLRSKLNHAK